MNTVLKTFLVALAFAAAATLPGVQAAPPNILIILVDDIGYSDIGCYGGEIRTPNIDRLAAHGMKFSDMYNTAKCYPTRAALLVDRVDQNIGRLLKRLEEQEKLDSTLILFLSDNGTCAEIPKVNNADPAAPMGTVASYVSYGQNWASVGNTPLRKWKADSFEGGIKTPHLDREGRR